MLETALSIICYIFIAVVVCLTVWFFGQITHNIDD